MADNNSNASGENNPDMIQVYSPTGQYPDEITITNANAQAAGGEKG